MVNKKWFLRGWPSLIFILLLGLNFSFSLLVRADGGADTIESTITLAEASAEQAKAAAAYATCLTGGAAAKGVITSNLAPDFFLLGTGGLINLTKYNVVKDSVNLDVQAECLKANSMYSSGEVNEEQLNVWAKELQKKARDEAWKNAIASAFKSGLSMLTKTIAYESAKWVASGGKGQQAQYDTRDASKIMQDAVDNALGEMVDKFMSAAGFNICQPDFNIKLNLLPILGVKEPPKPRCSLSTAIKNWDTAINNANFSLGYYEYFQPNQNDIGSILTVQTSVADRQVAAEKKVFLTAITDGRWKSITDVAKNILTPGSFIKEQWGQSIDKAQTLPQYLGGTAADFVETFLNTLTSELVKTLISGFFSKNADYGRSYNYSANPLYNSQSAPAVSGQADAEVKFQNLKQGAFTVGGPYDLLNRLASCIDPARPSYDGCVIDQEFAQAIRDKKQLFDLPDSIKNRIFAPNVNQVTNPQTAFTLRNIIILRKYRIVPVGWEIAARYIVEQGGTGKSYTLGDLLNKFEDGSEFSGLIDQYWVLKAPELFCRREGFGPDMSNSQGGNVSRDNYCGDEQQCIKEDINGSCQAYGYCTNEKRVWKFDAPKCEPVYNTCQTYQIGSDVAVSYLKNTLDYQNCSADNVGCKWYSDYYNNIATTTGILSGVATWMNTDTNNILNKCNISGGCTASVQVNVDRWNASNFGASQGYSLNKICDQQGDCNIGTVECRIPYNGSACKVATSSKIAEWTSRGYEIYLNLGVTTSTSNTKFFDRDAQTCASNQAGCSQFIRVGDGHQSGLVTTTTDGYKLAITNQDYDPSTIVANDIAYLKKAPWYYNCYSASANGSWPATQGELDDVLIKRNSECSNYAGVCIPSEVGCKLYEPKNGDPEVPGVVKPIDSCPSECDGYQVYRQSQTAFSSPRYTQFIANNKAKYCSASYAGCDEFTNLDELVAGGESKEYYTNLRICQKNAPIGPSDAKTYYTWEGAETTGYQLVTFKLKQSNSTGVESGSPCTKMQYNGASDKDAQCGDASNITDELIQTAVDLAPITNHNLVSYLAYISSTTDATQIPTGAVSQSVADKLHEYGICLKLETHGYNANGVDIAPNADCREFYDSNGDVYYRLLSKVIYVTDDCHPYRRTLTQDPSLTTQCAELNNENVSVTQCDCVSNNGFWSDEKECVYMAVPKMGQSCSASFVGCREYTGNLSNDINFLVNDNFDNSYSNWSGSNSNLSIVSTAVGGFSWFTKATTSKQVYVKRNHTYTLSFWAKGYPGGDNDHASSAGFDLESIKFSSASEQSDYFAKSQLQNISLNVPKVHIGNEWQRYDLGPVFVTFADDGWQDLTINPGATNSIGNDLYIDNITLKEVKGNVYVIENSWFTPNSCDNKLDDPTGTACANGRCNPGEMLGCQAYNNKTDNVDPIYLRSFTSLCRAEAVGCEAMIDTHNSNATSSESFGGTVATADSVSVVKDNLAFIVNDKKFSCLAENKGCSAYGQPVINNRNEVMGYSTVYIKNDPQTYSRSLCRAENLWCGEYATNNTYNYFKDPRQQVCEFKSLTTSSTPAWYRMGEDGLCDTSPYQTIGLGVVSEKLQPDQNMKWAGVCPSSQSSCTEFIDPLTNNYASLLYNGDFSQNLGDINRPDGWEINSIGFNYKKEVTHSFVTGIVSQDVNLIDDRLYSLSMLADGQVAIDVKCSEGSMRSPDGSMVISSDGSSASLNYNLIASSSVSGRLYARDTKNCTLLVGASGSVTDVKLTESGVYYNLSDQMTDSRASCQGMVDYRKGCVLLNDRGAVNYADNPSTRDRSYLIYDADYIENKNVGTSQAIAVNKANDDSSGLKSNVSANAVIKVQPDRQCASWLYCNTFEKGNVNDPNPVLGSSDQCLGLALCSALDGMGNCSLFVNNQNKISVYDKGLDINKTGYSMLGKQIPNASGKSSSTVLGYYPYHLMSQVGEDANIANSDFEYIYNADQPKPIGWKPGVDTAWTIDKFSVATSKTDRKEGIGYLKVNADGTVRSNPISVDGDNAYSFSAWINTSYLYPSPQAKVLISVNGRVIDTVSAGLPWQRISKPLPPEVYQNGGALYVSVQNCFATVGSGQNTKCMTIQQASTTVTTGCLDSNLDGQCDVSGYSLFDLISLKPILEAGKDVNNSNIYISRSCRLYPEGDSQACNYVKNGDMYNGWQGFCMVSDPNNPQICLQWWPVDKIKGDGEPYYFSKSFPLYYCAALEGDMHLVEHREVVLFNYTSKTIKSAWNSAAWYKWLGPPGLIYAGVNTVFFWHPSYTFPKVTALTGNLLDAVLGSPINNFEIEDKNYNPSGTLRQQCRGSGCGECPFGYFYHHDDEIKKAGLFKNGSVKTWDYCKPVLADLVKRDSIYTDANTSGWYEYNGDLQQIKKNDNSYFDEKEKGVQVYLKDVDGGTIMDYNKAVSSNNVGYCKYVEQVVDDAGNSKAWYSRLSAGDNFWLTNPGGVLNVRLLRNDLVPITINSGKYPFGSLVTPQSDYDPYMWDGGKPYTMGMGKGVTFGCDGDNCKRFGLCSISHTNCLAYGVVNSIILSGVQLQLGNSTNTIPRSSIGLGDLGCPTGEECYPFAALSPDTCLDNGTTCKIVATTNSIGESRELLKSIFARSYGEWEYKKIDRENMCVKDEGSDKTATRDSCTWPIVTNKITKWTCVGGFNDGFSSSTAFASTTCLSVNSVSNSCENWKTTTGKGICADFTDFSSLFYGTSSECFGLSQAEANKDCYGAFIDIRDGICMEDPYNPVKNYVCVGGPNDGIGCTTTPSSVLNSLVSCDSNVKCDNGVCDGGKFDGRECLGSTDIEKNNFCLLEYAEVKTVDKNCRYKTDPSGTIFDSGLPCSDSNDCDSSIIISGHCSRTISTACDYKGNSCSNVAGSWYHYGESTDSLNKFVWDLPTLNCVGNVRANDSSYCYIDPVVTSTNITLDGSNKNWAYEKQAVKLGFTVSVDSNQLPIQNYNINWGDSNSSSVSNVSMKDNRANPDAPYLMYHAYDYWKIKAENSKEASTANNIICSGDGQDALAESICGNKTIKPISSNESWCCVKINISVTDNWERTAEQTKGVYVIKQ